jgi:quinol monooxygenase YgiN
VPLYRLAEIEIDAAQAEAYRALLAEEIEASVRLEPGVLFLLAFAEKSEPGRVRVIEGYASKAAYEAHLLTPHFLKYKKGTAAMVKSLRLVELDPVALQAQIGALKP